MIKIPKDKIIFLERKYGKLKSPLTFSVKRKSFNEKSNQIFVLLKRELKNEISYDEDLKVFSAETKHCKEGNDGSKTEDQLFYRSRKH